MPTATAQADPAVQTPGSTTGRVPLGRLRERATRPVASSSVAVVRIAFGLVGLAGSVRFLARGWVDSLYLAPTHHLTYPGFDWVAPLPAGWAHLHVAVVAVAALAVALGWHTRAALATFLIGFVWLELIDAALYLNHYWLMTLIGLALFALPVAGRWSLDARAGRSARSATVPAWVVWSLRAQVGVVYVVAGLAKLDADWLFDAQPLGIWLGARTDRPVIGPWLESPAVAHVAAWASAIFDLTIVGWLSWRRTRPVAYLVVIGFHVGTAMLFQIGLFPWMMLALTPIFFDPAWPERMLRTLGVTSRRDIGERLDVERAGTTAATSRWVVLAVSALVVVNVVTPLRHHAYAGDVAVDEVGYYGSLRVMLTEKTGVVAFVVTDADTGATWSVDPMTVFEPWQVAQLAARPDLLVTAAHIVAAEARAAGHGDVEVRADGWVSINGAQRQRTVDPAVDLAALDRPVR